MKIVKKINKKFNNYILKNTTKVGVLNSMLSIIIIPFVLLIFKSIIFGVIVSVIISIIIYRITKEAYLINPKIIKGDAMNIIWVMSALLITNYIILEVSINYHWVFILLYGLCVLFELNTFGEYYNMEEIKTLK